MVLVGFFILPLMSFANLPNSLADERPHASLYFVLLINCLQFSSLPVSASMTAIA